MSPSEEVEPIVLAGGAVRLEPLRLDHAAALLAAAAEDRANYAFTAVPTDAAAMRRYLELALADRDADRALPFATVDVARDRVVGTTRFGNLEYWRWPDGHSQQRAPRHPDAVEIGWTWLAASAQRSAINTEAKLLMLGHAFERWRVHRVTLRTDVRNLRSRAAIERLGARLDGILRAQMPAADGGVRDSACYSIVAAEWPDVRARLTARLARA
jgi:RimJ/RimL family protein N-acetyltransferase